MRHVGRNMRSLAYVMLSISLVWLLSLLNYNRTRHLSDPVPPKKESVKVPVIVHRFPAKKRRITVLYYTSFFQRASPPYLYSGAACQETCFITEDRKYMSTADAFIVHGRDYDIPPEVYADKPWIFHSQENPANTPIMRDVREMSRFSYSSTARLDSDFPFTVWMGPNISTGGRGPDTKRAVVPFRNRKAVPIYVASSNCEPVRTEYQKVLMSLIDVDSYGNCLRNQEGLTRRYGMNFQADALNLQREYKFTLVFMNADCKLWVDTRLLNALEAGSVPIFMGTEDVFRFLPGMEDSIIQVSDFQSPEALASYIRTVASDEDLYNSYLTWRTRGVDYRGTEMEAVSSNVASWYCNICDKVRSDPKAHPGRVKAEQCFARKYEDWLPTPKYFNPEYRPTVRNYFSGTE